MLFFMLLLLLQNQCVHACCFVDVLNSNILLFVVLFCVQEEILFLVFQHVLATSHSRVLALFSLTFALA